MVFFFLVTAATSWWTDSKQINMGLRDTSGQEGYDPTLNNLSSPNLANVGARLPPKVQAARGRVLDLLQRRLSHAERILA